MSANDVEWIESAQVATPEHGDHFVRWKAVASFCGQVGEGVADCDYRDGGAYHAAFRKRWPLDLARVNDALAASRVVAPQKAEMKAKRRALFALGFTWEDAAKEVGS